MRDSVVAAVKEQFRDLRAENPGFGRLRQSRSFGSGPDSGSIDTHLQFLCTPTHTLTTVSYIQECILYFAVFFACTLLKLPPTSSFTLSFYMVFHSRSYAFLRLSLHVSNLILCNVTLLDLWC